MKFVRGNFAENVTENVPGGLLPRRQWPALLLEGLALFSMRLYFCISRIY